MHPQPLRRPDPATDHFSNQRPQNEKLGSPSNNLPYGGYAEGRPYWVCINNIPIHIYYIIFCLGTEYKLS